MRKGVLVACVVLAACGRESETRPTSLTGSGDSAADQPHVVFTVESLTLDRLEASVPAPVSSASRPSPETMVSDDPRVVEVDARGFLVAKSAGATTVRARAGNSALRVSVLAPRRISVSPAQVELEPRGARALEVRAEDGSVIPPEGVRWVVEIGAPIVIVGGVVHSTGQAGRYSVQAHVGASSAKALVLVAHRGPDKLKIAPSNPRFLIGEVRALQVAVPEGTVLGEWSSDAPHVLESLGHGFFQGKSIGAAKVCVTALDQAICARAEVRP